MLAMMFIVKRSSGRSKDGRELFILGVSRKDDVSVVKVGCDGRVEFETRSRVSEGGRTAAEAPVTTTSKILCMSLIVTLDKERQSTSLSQKKMVRGERAGDIRGHFPQT